MNCNCNNSNKATESSVIKHVQGNVLRLAIPLTLRTIEIVDGEPNATDSDFIPSSDYPVRVVFSKGNVKIALDAIMRDGNKAYIEDKGTIPKGLYDITITCFDDNGNPYRFNQAATLNVVNETIEAGIATPIEYEVGTQYLNAAIYLALKGEDGVGIEDIETESSGEIGGVNTVTFILTDGRTRSFNILNGSGSVDSVFDLSSLHPLSNRVITQRFNAVDQDMANLIGYADYDSTRKEIRFFDKDKTKILATLDAKPFIKDGMVNSVYISNNTLVITFNTDAGREAIGVPLSSVFNPNNYYTKSQVDNKLNALNDTFGTRTLYLTSGGTDAPVLMRRSSDGLNIVLQGESGVVRLLFPAHDDVIALYSDISTLYGMVFGKVVYDATSHRINFYAGSDTSMSNVLGYIDTTPFEGGGGTLTQVQADWDESDTTNAAYIRNKPTIPVVPTNVSAFMNDADYQSGQQVNDALLDKVDKVAGKQLSTEDYTSAEKTKLAGLSNYDDTSLRNAINSLQAAIDAITGGDTTTAIKTFQEVIDFLDGVTDDATLIGKLNELRTLINAKYTKPSTGIPASDLESGVIPDVSGKQDTLVSGDNIKTVNGVSILGAGDIDTSQITYGKFDDNNRTAFLPAITYNPITDTWTFSETPVTLASQMIYMDVTTDKHYMYVGRNLVEVGGVSGLATVATSGSYNDLKDKPTIPSAQVQSDWNATSGMGVILNKPTIPTVPSNVSAFTNDAGYLTQHQDISGKADKVTVVTVPTSGAVTQELAPNTFYKFTGALTSLTLTLTEGTGLVVYAGKFTADSSGCTLSLPATVTEAANNDTIEGGKTYEFSIVDNVIVIKEV